MKYTKLSIIIKTTQKPQYFIGSQIRGAFGYALKKVTCINPTYSCEGCFATSNCLYHQFYEEKNSYHKYRLDFELGKNYYDFSFYLFDDVCEKLPYIISALHMMLTQNGLGKEKVKYEVFEKSESIWREDRNYYLATILTDGGVFSVWSEETTGYEKQPDHFDYIEWKDIEDIQVLDNNDGNFIIRFFEFIF